MNSTNLNNCPTSVLSIASSWLGIRELNKLNCSSNLYFHIPILSFFLPGLLFSCSSLRFLNLPTILIKSFYMFSVVFRNPKDHSFQISGKIFYDNIWAFQMQEDMHESTHVWEYQKLILRILILERLLNSNTGFRRPNSHPYSCLLRSGIIVV